MDELQSRIQLLLDIQESRTEARFANMTLGAPAGSSAPIRVRFNIGSEDYRRLTSSSTAAKAPRSTIAVTL